MIPIGYGLPAFTDTTLYLSAPETRELPPTRYTSQDGTCLVCGLPPGGPAFRLEGAHAARKGMGGTKHDGPQFELCPACHDEMDERKTWAILIRRRDTVAVRVDYDGDVLLESELKW